MKDDVLYTAWENINRNTKVTGVDSLTIKQVKASGVEGFIRAVKEELEGNRYVADEVKRVEIPKMNGETRHLGILTVKDRLAQGAVKLILEPIFEADFEGCSYGYRAYRSAKLASLEVYKWLETGSTHYLKGDIKDCFDSIPHDKLMEVLKTRIEDKLILSLVESWLEKGSVKEGPGKSSRKGLLQGGIISPLLLNFFLDQFDNQWAEIGLKNVEGDSLEHLVCFADDFVILSREWIDPARVEASLAELDLKLNKEKTYVGTAGKGFEFLGFYFQETADEKGLESSIRIVPTEGSIEKIIESIESIEKSSYGDENKSRSVDTIIKNINRVIDSWVEYYSHTDHAVGLERIGECLNKKIKEFI